MERLHDTSTNAFGQIEHVYSFSDIDYVTRKIAEDEWMALGTAIAEAMYEMILDVGDEALHEMGFVERMSVTDKIAEDVTSAVEVSEFSFMHFVSSTKSVIDAQDMRLNLIYFILLSTKHRNY